MELKTILKEELKNEIEELAKVDLGTDKYDSMVDGVAELLDRYIKLEELELKQNESALEESRVDMEYEKVQNDSRKDIYNVIKDLAIIFIPTGINAIITIAGTRAMFEFEKEGTVTSRVGGKYIDRLFPKIK